MNQENKSRFTYTRSLLLGLILLQPFTHACAEADPNAILKAAERGDAEAQFNLGHLHEKGLGVPQDFKKSAAWYRKSAEQGYACSQRDLGLLYIYGRGVPQDFSQAYSWLSVAVANGCEYDAISRRDALSKKLSKSKLEHAQEVAASYFEKYQGKTED